MNVLFDFEKLIQEMVSELEKYSQKDTANEIYIQKQNKLIEKLIEIFNGLSVLKYQSAWEEIENLMVRMKDRDMELSGFYIEIRNSRKNDDFGFISYSYD